MRLAWLGEGSAEPFSGGGYLRAADPTSVVTELPLLCLSPTAELEATIAERPKRSELFLGAKTGRAVYNHMT